MIVLRLDFLAPLQRLDSSLKGLGKDFKFTEGEKNSLFPEVSRTSVGLTQPLLKATVAGSLLLISN